MFKAKKPKANPIDTKMAGAFNFQAKIDYKKLVGNTKTKKANETKKK